MKTKSIIYSAAVLSVAFVSCQKETVKQDNADCAIVASFDINNIDWINFESSAKIFLEMLDKKTL